MGLVQPPGRRLHFALLCPVAKHILDTQVDTRERRRLLLRVGGFSWLIEVKGFTLLPTVSPSTGLQIYYYPVYLWLKVDFDDTLQRVAQVT